MEKATHFRIRRDVLNKVGWKAWLEDMKISFDHVFEIEGESDGYYR